MAGRTTPELERVQAELGARLSFREASRVLDLFVPAARPHNHKSFRNRLARVTDHIETKDLSSPHRMSRVGPGPMSVFIDGAYIRAVPGFQNRHFEIIMGRVEADGRVARHFASAPNISTSDVDTIRAALRAQGWIPGRDITVFSDGDPARRGIVVSAERQQVTHVLDWFHISMRVRHIEQAFEGIRQFEPELKSWLLASVYCDVPRLLHLLWSGYVDETRDALMQFVDAAHELQSLGRNRPRLVIDRAPRKAEHPCLPLDREDMAAVDHRFALSRPALLSALSKKSLARVSSPSLYHLDIIAFVRH